MLALIACYKWLTDEGSSHIVESYTDQSKLGSFCFERYFTSINSASFIKN